MNKILNWFFGSFFRTLGRLLVFILLGYLFFNIIDISSIKFPNLFSVLQVNALENIDIFSDYNLSDSGMFWNITTNGETQKGYDLYTTNSPNAWYYASPTSDIPLNLNGGGMAITQCGYGILENNYYTISFVFNSNYTPYLHPFYTNRYGYIIGVSEGNTTYRNDINATDVSNNIEQIYYADGFYVDTFTIIFKANRNGSCITTTFSANSSVNYLDYFFFRGIKVNSLGQEVPTAQDIANAMSNNFNNVISNQNQNTTTIINNNNTNTNNIINNQNENTDKTIDSQKVCRKKEITYLEATERGYLSSDGIVNSTGTGSGNFKTTDYIEVSPTSQIARTDTRYPINICSYDVNKEFISCTRLNNVNYFYQLPTNVNYIRLTFYIVQAEQSPIYTITNICINGNQAIGDNLSDIENSINNSDISGASSDASNFFSNFTTDTHGLTGIITAPLTAINNLTSQTCSPLVLPLPFVNQSLTLPCMRDIYVEHFGSFMILYDIITLGIVSYWVMVRIFSLVKDFKNPEHDEIEVVDL